MSHEHDNEADVAATGGHGSATQKRNPGHPDLLPGDSIDERRHHISNRVDAMALAATLHCLTGCAIGEVAGLVVGTAAGLSTGGIILLSVVLAFVFGFTLSSLPLLKAGLSVGESLGVVVAADTLSIAAMEITDNAVMALIPGAMDSGLVNAVFWLAMPASFAVAFSAAYPVNRYLLQRGRGHALTHEYHHHDHEALGTRRLIPSFPTSTLLASLVAFMLGGLLVAVTAESQGGVSTKEDSRSRDVSPLS